MDFSIMKYDFKSSSIKIDNISLPIYGHENELLTSHLIKTKFFFHELMDKEILENFYLKFHEKNFINLNFDEFLSVIDDFIFFHDLGKISFNFQINRLNKNNNILKSEQLDILNKINFKEENIKFLDKKHSLTGSLSFLSKYSNIFNDNKLFIMILVYCIYSHHTNIKDFLEEYEFAYDISNETSSTLKLILIFLNITNFENIKNFSQKKFQRFQNIIAKLLDKNTDYSTSFVSFFYMYIYSLLISADVIATKNYYLDVDRINYSKISNRIDFNLKNRMENSFYNVSYNKNLNFKTSKKLSSINEINELRTEMLIESSNKLNYSLIKSPEKRIFFLNMPTGGGKTNTSMKLALDVIKNTKVNRIIYAMPFINIIEQNYDIIKNNYGLNEEKGEIRKIYSGSESIFFNEDDEFISQIILNDDFFNYPVICTTFVGLFNSIIKNKKKFKYKLNSLANSVIILDEIQSLPLKNWNSLYYLINEISNNFNIYFIIMSATLPNFSKLDLDKINKIEYETVNLINSPERFFNHYLFDRTIVRSIKNLDIRDELFYKYFLDILKQNFDNNHNKCLIVLNTIKSSRLIFDMLLCFREKLNFDIDLLNSTMLPFNKQKIISKVKNINNNSKRNYILVSTQSIEAGVDISFDFVIRDFSILDSIEQVRGRCNRNRELGNEKGNVYLIKLKDDNKYFYKQIYSEEEINTRILETNNLLKSNLNYNYSNVLNYYDNVSIKINKINDSKEANFILNDRNNIKNWNRTFFSELQDKKYGINIIDNIFKKFSLFIETDICIFSENLNFEVELKNFFGKSFTYEFNSIEKMSIKDISKLHPILKDNFNFTFEEIKYLKDKKYNGKSIIIENRISGKNLLNYYKNLINEIDKKDFNNFKILNKEFSSLLNKFIINVIINDENIVYDLEKFEKVGFFYVIPNKYIGNTEDSFYSLEQGFNFNKKIDNQDIFLNS